MDQKSNSRQEQLKNRLIDLYKKYKINYPGYDNDEKKLQEDLLKEITGYKNNDELTKFILRYDPTNEDDALYAASKIYPLINKSHVKQELDENTNDIVKTTHQLYPLSYRIISKSIGSVRLKKPADVDALIKEFKNFIGKYHTMMNTIRSNVSKDEPIDRQIAAYNVFSVQLEQYIEQVHNLFTPQQRQDLMTLNEEYKNILLSNIPKTNTEDTQYVLKTFNNISSVLDGPLLEKQDWSKKYRFSDKQLEELKIGAVELHEDMVFVLRDQIENMKKKIFGKLTYAKPKIHSKFGLISKVLLPERIKSQEKPVVNNIGEWQEFVNSLFCMIVYILYESDDLDAAMLKYEELKMILQELAEHHIYYSLAGEVSRLGDILVALASNKISVAEKLSVKDFQCSTGKLEFHDPLPIEERLFHKLAAIDKMGENLLSFRNNKTTLESEIENMARKNRDDEFIQYILSLGTDTASNSTTFQNIKNKYPKVIGRILQRYISQPVQIITTPSQTLPKQKGAIISAQRADIIHDLKKYKS